MTHEILAQIAPDAGGTEAGILAVLLMAGKLIKEYTPLPNKYIPVVTMLLGVVLFLWSSEWDMSLANLITTVIMAGGPAGLHAGTVRALTTKPGEPKP